jgi:hypothetical protein
MAIGTKERTELRDKLVSAGYDWNYIDEWQPKVTLYRHCAAYSPSGAEVSPRGTALHNLPGHPDYVQRKMRIGLFTWPPSDTCQCQWCVAATSKTSTNAKPEVVVEQVDGIPS